MTLCASVCTDEITPPDLGLGIIGLYTAIEFEMWDCCLLCGGRTHGYPVSVFRKFSNHLKYFIFEMSVVRDWCHVILIFNKCLGVYAKVYL